jgi:hypothetical protein
MWDAGYRMPTQTVDGPNASAARIGNKTSVEHIRACHMETADAR